MAETKNPIPETESEVAESAVDTQDLHDEDGTRRDRSRRCDDR
jgi:hypothetical protein